MDFYEEKTIAEKARKRYLRRMAFSDGFQSFGILISAISFAFTIIELVDLPVSELIQRLYESYSRISIFLYDSLFFWIRIDPPKFLKSLLTTYVIVGMTAARSAVMFFEITAPPSISVALTGFLGSATYFRRLKGFHRIGSIATALALVPLVMPVWPYLLTHNHSTAVAGQRFYMQYRSLFLRVLFFTGIGAGVFVIANSSATLYGYTEPTTADPESGGERPLTYKSRVFIVTAPSGLNLRASPGLDSVVLTAARHGSSVVVVSMFDDQWYEVRFGDFRGYMSAEFLGEQ